MGPWGLPIPAVTPCDKAPCARESKASATGATAHSLRPTHRRRRLDRRAGRAQPGGRPEGARGARQRRRPAIAEARGRAWPHRPCLRPLRCFRRPAEWHDRVPRGGPGQDQGRRGGDVRVRGQVQRPHRRVHPRRGRGLPQCGELRNCTASAAAGCAGCGCAARVAAREMHMDGLWPRRPLVRTTVDDSEILMSPAFLVLIARKHSQHIAP